MKAGLSFRVGINRLWPGEKLGTGDPRWIRLNGGFKPKTHTIESFQGEIQQGSSFCAELLAEPCGREHCGQTHCCKERRERGDPTHCGRPLGFRHSNHFKSAQHLALDYDTGSPSLDDLLADPFIANHATFIYPTISWTPDNQKWRVVFILSEPITDAEVYRQAATALLARYGTSDQSIKDPARFLYGMKPGNGEAHLLGNILPMGEVLTLLSEYDEQRRTLNHNADRRLLPPVAPSKITGATPDERYVQTTILRESEYLATRAPGSGERYPSIIPTAISLESLRLSDWLSPEARSLVNVEDIVLDACGRNGSLDLYGEAHLRKAIDWAVARAEPRDKPDDWGVRLHSETPLTWEAVEAAVAEDATNDYYYQGADAPRRRFPLHTDRAEIRKLRDRLKPIWLENRLNRGDQVGYDRALKCGGLPSRECVDCGVIQADANLSRHTCKQRLCPRCMGTLARKPLWKKKALLKQETDLTLYVVKRGAIDVGEDSFLWAPKAREAVGAVYSALTTFTRSRRCPDSFKSSLKVALAASGPTSIKDI